MTATETTTATESQPMPLRAQASGPLRGSLAVPGDKSISHRALMIGALAVGQTRIRGLLEGEDVLATASALRALGVTVCREPEADGTASYRVDGVGLGGLAAPASVLDMGNAGTGARLLLGVLASHPLTAQMTGDASLCSRPMNRVIAPLSEMGASFTAREGGRLPLTITGSQLPVPICYRLPVPSAQVKSAILLAGLNTPGHTTVIEPEATRDHTELMLRHFGAVLDIADEPDGSRRITLHGEPELEARDVLVPGDPSSAAFPAVAALLCPGSKITITGMGANPLRIGLFRTLADMGATIELGPLRQIAGEPVCDLEVTASPLKGVEVPADRAPSMIDEYPILAVAAGFAEGTTVLHGLAELRVKESNRFTAILTGLKAIGVACEERGDTLIIQGQGGAPEGGAMIRSHLDHRIAMAFLVAGLACRKPVSIDDGRAINTSFPGFVTLMRGLGATLEPGEPDRPKP